MMRAFYAGQLNIEHKSPEHVPVRAPLANSDSEISLAEAIVPVCCFKLSRHNKARAPWKRKPLTRHSFDFALVCFGLNVRPMQHGALTEGMLLVDPFLR